MDLFEEKIKAYAGKETVLVPDGFDERIEKKLAGLPFRNAKKNPVLKVLLVAAVFSILSAVTVLASPDIRRMAQGIISYFSAGQISAYSSQKKELEKYNSAVGVAVQDQGIILKIDNIAVDDGYINVFYTVQSNSPITIVGSEDTPMTWRLGWTAPRFFFKADGRELAWPALIEQEAYLENDSTLKGMERFAVIESLPDNFRLELSTDQVLGVKGKWQMTLTIDKSATQTDTLVVTPEIQASVTSGWENLHKHDITVDKVLISPFGSQLILSEKSFDGGLFGEASFALRDDQGRFLDIVPSQRWAGAEKQTMKVTNSFEFLKGSTGMKTLTLIPVASNLKQIVATDGSYSPVMATAPLGPLPQRLQQNELGAVVVDAVDLSEQGLKITYHSQGILEFVHFSLLDQNDRELKDLKLAVDQTVDRQTGRHTDTYTFTHHPSAAAIARISRIGIITYDLKLKTEEQIVIPLQ